MLGIYASAFMTAARVREPVPPKPTRRPEPPRAATPPKPAAR